VVGHPGFSPWLEFLDRSYLALRESLGDLAAIQEEDGVPVAVENMGSWEVCHFRDPSFLPALHEAGLSFCLDLGRAHINGMLDEFLAIGRPLHVHLHDNDDSGDAHRALGNGNIDLSRVLPLLLRTHRGLSKCKRSKLTTRASASWRDGEGGLGPTHRGAGYVEFEIPPCFGVLLAPVQVVDAEGPLSVFVQWRLQFTHPRRNVPKTDIGSTCKDPNGDNILGIS